jgi:hypothetical protein
MITTPELVHKILTEAPTVEVECTALGIPLSKRFIVEGDVGLTESGVAAYAAQRIEIAVRVQGEPDAEGHGLLGIERNGKILRWRPGKTLTYCVWHQTFQTDAEYEATVDGMTEATSNWESICGIRFEHLRGKDKDANLTFGDVDFPVLRQLGGGSTIAMAFFPDDPLRERIVWVFDGYFDPGSSFDPAGVLRHELGHVLGFRHEHIRPEAPDLFNPESTAHTVEITEYDPKSVMHYVAGNVGDPRLKFTELDRSGARAVYGGPFSEFEFAD